MHPRNHILTHALFLVLIITLAFTFGIFLLVRLLRHHRQRKATGKVRDLEALGGGDEVKEANQLPAAALSASFNHLPIACPTPAYFPLTSSKRIQPTCAVLDSFIPILKLPTSVDTTTSAASNASHCAPPRPPLPTKFDDFFASFPFVNDVWFPLANRDTGRWELCVVDITTKRPIASGEWQCVVEKHSAASVAVIEGGEAPGPDGRDTSATIPVFDTKKQRKKGKSKRRGVEKRRRGYRPLVFEIPELYVNARSYDEIEAEQEAKAKNHNFIPAEEKSYLDILEEYDTNFLFPTFGIHEIF